MAFELFKLAGSIFIDTKEADKSLSKTESNATSFGETFGKVAGGVITTATAIVGGVTAVGGAVVGVANSASKTADEIDKSSIRMGVSTEAYQEFAYVAGQCGVEMATLEKGAKQLEGTDISFDEAMKSIMSLTTAEERASKASELFGETVAYKMSPMIEQSTESYDGLIQRSHDLGLIMSEDAVSSGVAFGDLMSDLKQSVGMLATNLGGALFPILNTLIEYAIAQMPTIQGFVAELAPILTDFLDQLIPQLVSMGEELMPLIFDTLEAIIPILVDAVSTVLPTLVEIIAELLPVVIEIVQMVLPVAVELLASLMPLITALLPLIPPIAQLLLTVLEPLLQIVEMVLPPLIEAITTLVNVIIPLVIESVNGLGDVIRTLFEDVLSNGEQWVKDYMGLFNSVISFIKNVFAGDFKGALNSLVDIGKGVVNVFFALVESAVNTVLGIVNSAIVSIVDTLNFLPSVNIKAPKINTLKIPRLENGGVLDSAGSVLVGEKAPEILNLPRGASVHPLDSIADSKSMKDAIIEALREVAPELQSVVEINADSDGLFDVMRKKQEEFYTRTGRYA